MKQHPSKWYIMNSIFIQSIRLMNSLMKYIKYFIWNRTLRFKLCIHDTEYKGITKLITLLSHGNMCSLSKFFHKLNNDIKNHVYKVYNYLYEPLRPMSTSLIVIAVNWFSDIFIIRKLDCGQRFRDKHGF